MWDKSTLYEMTFKPDMMEHKSVTQLAACCLACLRAQCLADNLDGIITCCTVQDDPNGS